MVGKRLPLLWSATWKLGRSCPALCYARHVVPGEDSSEKMGEHDGSRRAPGMSVLNEQRVGRVEPQRSHLLLFCRVAGGDWDGAFQLCVRYTCCASDMRQ